MTFLLSNKHQSFCAVSELKTKGGDLQFLFPPYLAFCVSRVDACHVLCSGALVPWATVAKIHTRSRMEALRASGASHQFGAAIPAAVSAVKGRRGVSICMRFYMEYDMRRVNAADILCF